MIRYVPRLGETERSTIHSDDVTRYGGDFIMTYRFPYQDDVEFHGIGGLAISGLHELLSLTPAEITSTQPLSDAAANHLEAALRPLSAEFRATAGRIAAGFWGHLDTHFWQVRFTPMLALRVVWGPLRQRQVEVYLKRPGDAWAIEWHKLANGQIRAEVSTRIANQSTELAALFARVAADRDIVAETARLFVIGERARASMMRKPRS
jgi:hypothetical protein